jgi:hypothetical protein
MLVKKKEGLHQLERVIQSKRRAALTCFEADPFHRHRHCVGEWMALQYGYRVTHL